MNDTYIELTKFYMKNIIFNRQGEEKIMNMTGKASIDKPWLNFYPEQFKNIEVPKMTVEAFLKMKNPDENRYALEYYGRKFTWKEFWREVDLAARALKVLGFEEGDRIPVFLQAVPSHYILLLAAERIGAALICRDDTPEELCFAIRKSKAETVFVHDYTSKEDEELFRRTTSMTRMIKVSPYDYADKHSMPDYVIAEIASRYAADTETTDGDMTWDEFLDLGRAYKEKKYCAPANPDRPLFGAYTSGSTGISKLVVHSGANIVSIAFQMSIFIPPLDVQETWWLPILTPALIAITVSMTVFPLSAGLIVRLDPFCPLNELDVAFMANKPNFWALIPMFCEMLMKSDRIPEDYDMSHLRSIGTGAEAMNERKSREVEEFFHKHGCMATLSAGYGQSEGCSNFTLPNPMFPLVDGNVGMPMPATVLAVFDVDTLEEKSYGEMGEVCMKGPGMMLGYSGYRGDEMTERTMVRHADGEIWLHTGDIGYITEHGIVHILGRGYTERFGGGYLFIMRMESKVVEADGVKDGFFCLVPDVENNGYFVPYLYVVLDEGRTLDEVTPNILATLDEHEYPEEITVIEDRPYFHFKTNRKELTAAILERIEKKEAGRMKVTWNANNFASGYEICYSSNENFIGSKTVQVPSAQTVKEVIGGLKPGMKYFVKVRAYNTKNSTTYYSAWSEVQSIIHAKVELENVSNGIAVTWTKIKDATEYRVYRKPFGEKEGTRIAVVTNGNQYIDTEVENGVRYCYYVGIVSENMKAATNVAAQMFLQAPSIDKLWNN